jgi:hypothetical protein
VSGDRVVLGWQFALPHSDPGPAPRRPSPDEHPRLDPGWVAAQRREENLLDRPLKLTAAVAGIAGLALLTAALAGAVNAIVAGLAITICVIAGAMSSAGVWQGERALRARVAAERVRVERFRADADAKLTAAQDEHARRVRDWQARRFAFESQKRWYGVTLPSGIDRVDLAGGTLPGWSALATTLAAYRLAAGGEVTILDVSGGSVGSDLLAVARGLGVSPLVWVLPGDLPRLDLTSGLDAHERADLFAMTANAGSGPAPRDIAADTVICERVLGVLGDDVPTARFIAGLRVLAGVGDPLADVTAGLLTADEVVRLTTLYGHDSAVRIVAERSWNLVAALEGLAPEGSDVPRLPHSRLRVVAVDPAAEPHLPALGTFAVTALARLLRQAPAGPPDSWRHCLMVFGADRIRADVLDQVSDACSAAGVGLLLAFRSVPAGVRERLGRGNAAVAFMRLGNAEDAKAASEQLGSEHRFVLSQLTDTIGSSVTDTTATSYTSTVSASGSLSSSVTVSESSGSGRSRSTKDGPLPEGGSLGRERSRSRGTSSGESVTGGIAASSAWGLSTSSAAGDSESVAVSLQRSRELLVEPHELQQLPPTALILSYASAAGRSVILADVNPGIGSLPAATRTPLGEAAMLAASQSADPSDSSNLGPPPARLDWRRPRS